MARFYEIEDDHWWFRGRRRIVLDQVKRYAPSGPILDLGCGTGGTLAALNGAGPACGIDPSPEALRWCGERGLDVALASGTQLPFPPDSFATVLALDVIEHVDDDVGLLRELRRVLKPDGVAVITVPALPQLWSSHDDLNQHKRRYLRRGLESALRTAGLEPLKMSYYNAFLLPLAFIRKAAQGHDGGTHLESLPRPVNSILRRILGVEAMIIRHWDIPLGASLVATVRCA